MSDSESEDSRDPTMDTTETREEDGQKNINVPQAPVVPPIKVDVHGSPSTAATTPLEKAVLPVPLLVLPTKAIINHLNETEKSKPPTQSGASGTNSRPTVPPLVFPLANIFEERTPLAISGHASGMIFGSVDSGGLHPHGQSSGSSSTPQWDPSEPNTYVITELKVIDHLNHKVSTQEYGRK